MSGAQISIGEKIRAERERQGISQNQLAKDAGISQSGLSAIENTTKNPSIQTIVAIATALRLPLSRLVDDDTDEGQAALHEGEGLDHDPDIRRLARAKKKMPDEEWKKMMKIAEVSFEKYFQEGD